MAEPTLGRRIMIEATICKDAPAGSAMAGKAWADLRALCARADAAERGMVAVIRREALADAWYVADELDVAVAKAALDVADTEYDNALADWRALGEVDG